MELVAVLGTRDLGYLTRQDPWSHGNYDLASKQRMQFQDPTSGASGSVRKRPVDKTEDAHQSRKVAEGLTPWSITALLEMSHRCLLQCICRLTCGKESTVRALTLCREDWSWTLKEAEPFLNRGGVRRKH